MGMFDEVLENVGEPYKTNKGFTYGTHEVIIGTVEPTQKKTKNNPESAVIEVEVYSKSNSEQSAKTTLYFHTEGGAKMSLTKILGILVHNAGEDKKDKIKELGKRLFSNIDDPIKARDVAAKLMAEKMIGKEAFLFIDQPQGKYKTSSFGDLWHYKYEDPDYDEKIDAASIANDIVDESSTLTQDEFNEIPDFEDL